MTWDDELEDLTQRVFDAYGDQALGEAYYRALMAAPALDNVDHPLVERFDDAVPDRRRSKFVDARESSAFFKAELRKLLTQH